VALFVGGVAIAGGLVSRQVRDRVDAATAQTNVSKVVDAVRSGDLVKFDGTIETDKLAAALPEFDFVIGGSESESTISIAGTPTTFVAAAQAKDGSCVYRTLRTSGMTTGSEDGGVCDARLIAIDL